MCVAIVGPAAVLRWLRPRISHVLPEASNDPASRRYDRHSTGFFIHQWVDTIYVTFCILERGYKQRLYMAKSKEDKDFSLSFSLISLHRELELSLVSGLVKRQGLSLRRSVTPWTFFSTHADTQYIYLYLYINCLTFPHISRNSRCARIKHTHIHTHSSALAGSGQFPVWGADILMISYSRAAISMQTPSSRSFDRTEIQPTAGLPFSHFSTSPLSRRHEAKARKRPILCTACVCEIHARIKIPGCFFMHFNAFDLKEGCPKVCARSCCICFPRHSSSAVGEPEWVWVMFV